MKVLYGVYLICFIALCSLVCFAEHPAQTGWPRTTGGSIEYNAAVADIDKDGKLDIIASSGDGKVYAWKYDGTKLFTNEWLVDIGGIPNSPSAEDLDKDGNLDIVVSSSNGKIYLFSYIGDVVWSKDIGSALSSPTVEDIDGDGNLDIAVCAADGKVYAWKADGTKVAEAWGDTVVIGGPFGSAPPAPAIANLDGTGASEVIVASPDGKLYVFDSEGTKLWEADTFSSFICSPAVGDISGDENLEIVAGVVNHGVYAWDYEGNQLSNWPQSTGGVISASPTLANLGSFNILVASNDGYLYVWDGSGTALDGWPKKVSESALASSPVVGDIDGDGQPEAIVGCNDNFVYAFEANGNSVSDWPCRTNGTVTASAVIKDIDADGDKEVIIGSNDGSVYIWDCEGIRRGDVNQDGSITPGDALLAFNIYLGVYDPTPIEEILADMNEDGDVTPGDALFIFNEYLGL